MDRQSIIAAVGDVDTYQIREYESKEGVAMRTFALFPTIVVSSLVK